MQPSLIIEISALIIQINEVIHDSLYPQVPQRPDYYYNIFYILTGIQA